jgi:hypothetical protein
MPLVAPVTSTTRPANRSPVRWSGAGDVAAPARGGATVPAAMPASAAAPTSIARRRLGRAGSASSGA